MEVFWWWCFFVVVGWGFYDSFLFMLRIFIFLKKIFNASLLIHAGYSRKGRLVLTPQSMHCGVGWGEER